MVMAMGMAIAGMIMDPSGLTVGAMGMTMIGVIVGLGGLTMADTVLAGIRVTERMPQGTAITLIQTNASPQATAGIHAPIIIMATR
jgi:hypothetical protein